MARIGIVYLVGAGPGDPGLITVRGLECLHQAEVVVHDRLISPRLLEEAPSSAKRINVGKAPGHHPWRQPEINDLLIAQARKRKIVVRIKGGDPFMFGRGGEECQALARVGIPYEVVPGVTSAIAVPAYAGIPVTHREHASAFTVVTGHPNGPSASPVDWGSLASAGTLVILMGVRSLRKIATKLVDHGRSPETPVALIRMGTTPEQVVVQGTLADIADKAKDIRPPATIVVGQVVDLHRELAWFNPSRAEPHAFASVEHIPSGERLKKSS